jgi:NAD(P)H-hydrate repair Nnr-like enzyme with NAD(P)H-hydrate dehydratase domain
VRRRHARRYRHHAGDRFWCWRIKAKVFRNEPALWLDVWPHHGSDTHKYRRGSVLVLAGGLDGVGAPRLAARAALRSGAGLVTSPASPRRWPPMRRVGRTP